MFLDKLIMAKPLKKQERQEAVSSLGKAVSRVVEKQTTAVATYSLAQAIKEKTQVCLDFDKKLKIIENLLIKVQDQTQRSKLLMDQKEYQQQKEEALAHIRHLEQLIELKDKSKECLVFLEEYYLFLRKFFEDCLEASNFNAGQIYALSKKESELIQSFETDILEKIESLDSYSTFIPAITKNLKDIFRDFSFANHLSFSSQFFFLTGIYPLLKPYRNALTYDQYNLDQIQYWLQELWLKNIEIKEDYLFVGLLALVVCKVVSRFFERKPIESQRDKLLKYTELADYFLAEDRLKNKLYALKSQLKEVGEHSILFFQKGLNFSRENIRQQLIFIDKIYSKISLLQEKIIELIKVYAPGKQWPDLKKILSKSSSENFLDLFKRTTGIESYYFPDSDNIKSVTEVLIFYSALFTNTESKEKLSAQLNDLMIEFKVVEDNKKPEELNIAALTLKDFISFGYLVLITVIYHNSQSAACKLKENLACFKGYVTNIILLQLLKDIHQKRQKVEAIKDKFLRNNHVSCQNFLEAKNAVLEEVTLLFDFIGKAIDIIHEESNLISSMMWQITLNGCVLNTEETIFYRYWNDTASDFSALQDHLKDERDYWIEQRALICQRIFILKKKEILSRSSSSEFNKQKKEFPSTAYTDLFCSCQIFYQNLEESIKCINTIHKGKGGQRKKDRLLAQFSSAWGQLAAHPMRLLKQLQTLDLSNELNDEMITPVLRLKRLKEFTERSLMDPVYQFEKDKMSALIELLDKIFESINQLSTLVDNVTESYRATNQNMEITLKDLEEKLAQSDQLLTDTSAFEKVTTLFQLECQDNLQACWLEKLIKIVSPNQAILTDFYQEIQRYREYQELAWLLHQECSRLTQEKTNKKLKVTPSKKKRVYALSEERSETINQNTKNTKNTKPQSSNEEAACLSPNVVEPILYKEDKTNFTLWQIEFEQWRLNYSQDLFRIFSCIDQCFFSTAIQMKVVFLEILRRHSLCLREKQETFLSRLQQDSTWLNQLDPVRPIYRRLHEQKSWLQNKIELIDMYTDRLRTCEQPASGIAPPSLYKYVQLTAAFTLLAAPEFHHLLSDYLKSVICLEKYKINVETESQKLTNRISEIMKSSFFYQEVDQTESETYHLFLEEIDKLNQLKDLYWQAYQNKIQLKHELIEKIGWDGFVLYASRVDPREASCFVPSTSFTCSQATIPYASLTYPTFFGSSTTMSINEVNQGYVCGGR